MSNCKHLVLATRNGRALFHSPGTERQIELALLMPADELSDWIRRSGQVLSQMRPEAIVFLLLHFRRFDHPLLVEELATALQVRIRVQILHSYLPRLGRQPTEDLCNEVCSQAWIVLLASPHGRGIWMQVCFDRFISSLCRDVLRKTRAHDVLSFDSNAEIRKSAFGAECPGPSAEDLVYLQEVLARLAPRQRQAFLMRRGLNECQRAIALAVHRSERSVRTLLKKAERQLKAAS